MADKRPHLCHRMRVQRFWEGERGEVRTDMTAQAKLIQAEKAVTMGSVTSRSTNRRGSV